MVVAAGDGLCAHEGEVKLRVAMIIGSTIFIWIFLVEVRGSPGNPGTLSGEPRSVRLASNGLREG